MSQYTVDDGLEKPAVPCGVLNAAVGFMFPLYDPMNPDALFSYQMLATDGKFEN